MSGARIDDRRQPQLVYAVETLEQRVLYDAIEQTSWYLDKSENRIIDDLCAFHLEYYITPAFFNSSAICCCNSRALLPAISA